MTHFFHVSWAEAINPRDSKFQEKSILKQSQQTEGLKQSGHQVEGCFFSLEQGDPYFHLFRKAIAFKQSAVKL